MSSDFAFCRSRQQTARVFDQKQHQPLSNTLKCHSVPYNHSHSRPVTTSMHFQELPNSICSEHTLNNSQSSFNANTVGQFSSMSTAHNTGYVPVTSHTDQFLSVSLPTICTSCIPVISSTGSSHMGCLGNNPSFPSVQNVQDLTPISYPSGRSQNTVTNYDTSHRFQNCQIPSSDVSQQNLDVRSFPDIAQLIKSEVDKAVKKLSTEYQQSKSADSQFQYRYQSASEPYSTESSDDEISANLELNCLLLMARRIGRSGMQGLKKQQKGRDGMKSENKMSYCQDSMV